MVIKHSIKHIISLYEAESYHKNRVNVSRSEMLGHETEEIIKTVLGHPTLFIHSLPGIKRKC